MKPKLLMYSSGPTSLHSVLDEIKGSPSGGRLARGIFWLMAGAIISRGLMLAASVLVARFLGKAVFGELGIVQSTMGMFGILAGFGLGMTATKYVAEFHRRDPERAGRILALSGVTAIITGGVASICLYIFAPWLSANTLNAPHLAGILKISCPFILIGALNGAQTGALAGFEAFKTIAFINIYVGLISFPILVIGAFAGGLRGAVWALVINLGINWVLNQLALRKQLRKYNVRPAFRNCNRELPILWKFSFPAVLASLMVGPINWVCSALLVNQPNGYEEMGIFNAANQWHNMLQFLPNLLGQVALPILSERLGQQDRTHTLKTTTLAIKLNALFVFPVALLASITSPYIMGLYGPSFKVGWPTLIIVLLTAGIIAVQTPVGKLIAASDKMWIGLIMNAAWALIFIVSTLCLVKLGAMGLAISRAIAYALHSIWVFAYAFSLTREP